MTAIAPFLFSHATGRVIFAPDALPQLPQLAEQAGCRKACLIVDPFVLGGPLEERLRDLLGGLGPVLHAVPQHEPDSDSVEAARDVLLASGADLVVALGGGSAMDTAKAARMLASNGVAADALANPRGMTMTPHASLFVCLPTTAGTGSEVSESAIVAKAGTDYKMVLRSAEMAADVALLDPDLGVSAPPKVTATAGYDAVTHAVEAFGSKLASPLTDPFAVSAMRLLGANLERAWRDPEDREARAACLIGAMQAGIAFNSAHLGLAHAIAGAMGALHHTPHGLANALALPWTTAFNEAALGDKATVIAECIGGPGGGSGARESAAEALSRLRHAIELDIGLDSEVPDESARDRLAESAMGSGQVRMNVRLADRGQVRVIVEHMRRPTGGGAPHLNL